MNKLQRYSVTTKLGTYDYCLADEVSALEAENERLRKGVPDGYSETDLVRAFQLLEVYGVPKSRARYLSQGIEVLVSRMDKEISFLRDEREDAWQQISQVYFVLTGESPKYGPSFSIADAVERIREVANMLKETILNREQEQP